jgi:hypothetical protein
MTTLGKLLLAIIVLILAALAWLFLGMHHAQAPSQPVATSTPSGILTGVTDVTYVNSNLSFSITHPSSLASSSIDFSGYLPLTQAPLVSFVVPQSMYAGTNLEEAGVYVGASSSPQVLTACTSAMPGETLRNETINGADFVVATSSGAGAGNLYESKIYRRIENGWCVEVVELLHSGNIGNYTPGAVKEFDHAFFANLLDTVVHTYRSIPTGA